jgi:DUF1680 family protein
MEGMIRRVAAAQEPDGYLYTFRTMHPDSPAHKWIHQQRWLKDPEVSHELYNIGHMYEAGVAHAQATGSRSLLNICLKNAELVDREFSDGEPRIAPGHQVIEMGLAKLYRQTGDARWIHLARFFIEARGYGNREYSQDHIPVTNQTEAVGHAVRANYLYSGMADVTALTGDQRYLPALKAIWENVVGCKLHITGGCGALAAGEAYGKNYELPNNAYNETCAAIAFMFWNHRMFLLTGEAKYMDAFERTLYNGFLSGVSLSGDRFFYPNTLEYDGSTKNNHGYAGRAPWFGCACCPPNVLRMLASLSGYAFAVRDRDLFINLYAQGVSQATIDGNLVDLETTTDYPWDGRIRIQVTPRQSARFAINLRIPGWVRGEPVPSDLYSYEAPEPEPWGIKVNGLASSPKASQGMVRLDRDWKSGDVIEIDFPMSIRRVVGNARIDATRGRVALERGPIVYCFEGMDNDGRVNDLCLPKSARFAAARAGLLNGVVTISVSGAVRAKKNGAGGGEPPPVTALAIPYHAWNNRGLSPMAVWLFSDPSNVLVSAPGKK